jgi:hypothetical protein
MRPNAAVAVACSVAVFAIPATCAAADPIAEIATKGIRWLSLPQEADFEVTYRIKDAKKARDLFVTCIVPFQMKQAGRGTLDETLGPVRGELIGVGFGSNYAHSELRAGNLQGSIYTTMETEVTGAEGTLAVHCEPPRLGLQGIGRAIIVLHKKDSPDKPLSNQVLLPMAASDEARQQLRERYGPPLETAPVETAPTPAGTPAATGTAPAVTEGGGAGGRVRRRG